MYPTDLYRHNGSFANPPWDEASWRVLVVRLSPFRDVVRSTPHLFLFREVRRAVEKSYVDFAFLPTVEERAALSSSDQPMLHGTQSRRGAGDFDLVLFSNSFLLELVNLPLLLRGSGIPLWAGERDGRWPPMILGGSNATACQSIIAPSGDCMADAVFFGEGEGACASLVGCLRENAALPKRERMVRAADAVEGLWPAGDLARRVRPATCAPEAVMFQGEACPVLPGGEAGTARLQISWGCPARCSFCFESWDRAPYREGGAEELLRAALRLKAESGAHTLELASFNFNVHSDFSRLIRELNRLFLRVQLMSQRVDVISRTPGLLEEEIAADKRSYTLGVEGISGRMRRFLHKSLETVDLRSVTGQLLRQRIREIKLFYLLTGREEEEDFLEFSGEVRALRKEREGTNPSLRVIFSFGRLVRMPFTPLRHDALLLEEKAWKPLIGRAKSICETAGFEFRLATSWDEYLLTQVLASGGHALSGFLQRSAERGLSYDGGPAAALRGIFDEWRREAGFSLEALSREKGEDHPFPLGFLEAREPPGTLWRRWRIALSATDHGYCRRSGWDGKDCKACEACGRPEGRDRAVRRPQVPHREAAVSLGRLVAAKQVLVPVRLEVRIPEEAATRDPEWLEAWMLRELLRLHPTLVENALALRVLALAPGRGGRYPFPWYGLTHAALTAWDPAAALAQLPAAGDRGAAGGFSSCPAAAGAAVPAALRVRMRLPAEAFPDAGRRLAAYCQAAHAPVVVERTDDGYRLSVPAGSRKRKVLLEGRYAAGEGDTVLDLLAGPRFDFQAFLSSFPAPDACDRALGEVLEVLAG